MSNGRVVPTPDSSDLPTYRILIEGEEITKKYHLLALNVTKAVNKIPVAKIRLLDGDASKEDFEISNTDLFVPGKSIEIMAGYHSEESTLFQGIIIRHGIKSREGKHSILEVECKDEAVKMTVGRKNAYFQEMTDSDIMAGILGQYNLDADVSSTSYQHPEMIQYYSTDWDYLVERADSNGLLVIVDDGTLSVTAPDAGKEPALSLVYGSTMMEFEASMDARTQFAGCSSSAWDYGNQEVIEEAGEDPGLELQGNLGADDLAGVLELDGYALQHPGHVVDHELRTWASAKLAKSQLSRVLGRVKCQGFAEIKPGDIVDLQGVGDRFNGPGFVGAVHHDFTVDNWVTTLQIGVSPEWFSHNEDIIDIPAAGLVPSIHGLQIGVVTQLEGDPGGEDRVRVRMPMVNADDDGTWARVVSLDAGENRGAFFRPEIGDEVILGFLNDDPRDPVVLGMMNSSAKPAPFTASDDNHEKGFVTRSEMKVVFNDDKKSTQLETPGGNVITLSDDAGSVVIEDQNSNKIEMASGGITIESAADINIKASGNLTIEGINVNTKANGQFKAEGSAGAEMSTSAIAVVKGSLVQIN